jgi:hypothetical protein
MSSRANNSDVRSVNPPNKIVCCALYDRWLKIKDSNLYAFGAHNNTPAWFNGSDLHNIPDAWRSTISHTLAPNL